MLDILQEEVEAVEVRVPPTKRPKHSRSRRIGRGYKEKRTWPRKRNSEEPEVLAYVLIHIVLSSSVLLSDSQFY